MTACERPDCDEPAIARVAVPVGHNGRPVYALVKPLRAGDEPGPAFCADCAHHAVDAMLMSVRPARGGQ